MTKSYMPLLRPPRQFKRVYFILIPLIFAVIVLHVFFNGFSKISDYLPTFITNRILKQKQQHKQTGEKSSNVISSYYPSLAIYPKNFDNRVEYVNEPENSKWIQYFGDSKTVLSNYITNQTYTNHTFGLYSSSTTKVAGLCKDILYERSFEITKYRTLHDDLYILTTTLLNQLENDPAFQDLSPFFKDRLPHIIMRGELHKHIYKFAGTSVWLEQHGVHLMLSRVIYSQKGRKNDPQLSLLYAQVYDENWNELNDIELIVPVINPNGERVYDSVKYPQFVAIPFYHNSEYIKSRWYGPEDTRLILTKNKFGDDEPVIIFNSYHRQIKDMSTEDDNNVHTKFEFYRSMFVGWLFQYQLGKLNTDGIQDSKFNNVTFNKVKELRIEGKERTSVEKNWTPFIDPDERNQISYYGNHNLGDNYVYIVYQWNHLKILKCELDNFIDSSHSTCTMIFKDVETTQEVGPVRGGTELWPIKIDNNNNDKIDELPSNKHEPKQRQLWIGFLRAHVKDCGCGGSMYRPNFLILEKMNSKFKLTYLSGSINFNVTVYGWLDYDVVCAGHEANALIPNGISMFDQDEDYLTLTMSVADQDNTLVHIHGVKNVINLLDHDWDGILKENKQIERVVKNATDYCKAYGEEHYKLGDSEAAIKEVKKKAKEEAARKKAEKEKARKEKEEKEKEEKEKAEQEKANKEKEEKEKADKEMADKELAEQEEEEGSKDEGDKEKNDESEEINDDEDLENPDEAEAEEAEEEEEEEEGIDV